MDALGLCQPASAILLVSIAGVLYHVAVGAMRPVVWWAMVGIFGTGVFQGLCYGGLEPVAWVLASIPILIVCFFLAVALLASKFRIRNVEVGDCRQHGGCAEPQPPKKPRCNRTRCDHCGGCGCPSCMPRPSPCGQCGGGGCPNCHQEGFQNPNCPCGCGQNPAACDPARCRLRCAVDA